ncbi:glycosyltransferase [Salmonella enterica]|nr:glycosyltransferase [Salmonella enterica]
MITATYNSQDTLKDTLLSVEQQDYPDIEYIIIDGGSSDQTLQLIKKYSTRVKCLISEKDNGIYDALNKGVKLATGDIVGFIHSDDILASPQVISNIVNKFKGNTADIVYGDLLFVDREKPDIIHRFWHSGEFKKSKLRYGWAPPHPAFYIRRELYKKYGCFDLIFKIAADYDQMLRLLLVPYLQIIYVPEVFVKMRLGGESTKLNNALLSTKEIIAIMRKHNINWQVAILTRKLSKLWQIFSKFKRSNIS